MGSDPVGFLELVIICGAGILLALAAWDWLKENAR